jgi:hypothetical protein
MKIFKQKTFFLFLGTLFLQMPDLASATSGQEDDGWEIYANARFQYQICYPSRLLKPQGEPDNGDGQQFLASDGGVLTVFGQYNALNASFDEMAEQEGEYTKGEKGNITYKVLRKNWAVFSGYDGSSNEFYKKIIQQGDRFFVFEIKYPASKKEKYSAIIVRLVKCFFGDS